VARQFPRYTGNRLRWSCRLVGLCNGGSKQVFSKLPDQLNGYTTTHILRTQRCAVLSGARYRVRSG
jgi:hypothetical protein